ncbi:hypothetical protein Pelo_15288 [Pelomyxa schiedti]|nr:hypothetical protein Pelo_15288 [Pelomyxa schiedti]
MQTQQQPIISDTPTSPAKKMRQKVLLTGKVYALAALSVIVAACDWGCVSYGSTCEYAFKPGFIASLSALAATLSVGKLSYNYLKEKTRSKYRSLARARTKRVRVWMIFAALSFSLVGDIALMLPGPDDVAFKVGVASFAGVQIIYALLHLVCPIIPASPSPPASSGDATAAASRTGTPTTTLAGSDTLNEGWKFTWGNIASLRRVLAPSTFSSKHLKCMLFRVWVTLDYTLTWAGFLWVLSHVLGSQGLADAIPVVIYMILISFMKLTSITPLVAGPGSTYACRCGCGLKWNYSSIAIAFGASMLVYSDIVLACDRFVWKEPQAHTFAIHSLYHLGQAAVVLGTLSRKN